MVYLSDMIKQYHGYEISIWLYWAHHENHKIVYDELEDWDCPASLDGGTLDEALEYLKEYDINIINDYEYLKSFNVDVNKQTVEAVIINISSNEYD